MTDDTSVKKAELLNVLIATNCPLLVRSDEWWIDELLFRPGKPRTELLQWVISKATNTFGGSSDLESTTVSSISNSFKLPETDEGIFEVLVMVGICSEKDMSFVQGNMTPAKQVDYWSLLLKPLIYLDKGNVSTSITFGCSALHNTVNMENFLDAFTLKASLLPADIQHEIKLAKDKVDSQESDDVENLHTPSLLYDETFVQAFSEKVGKLRDLREQFVSMYNNDLKISIPKNPCVPKLIDIGQHIDSINAKVAAWNEKMDTVMDLGRRNNLESARQRTETSLKLASKDQSFEPFKNLCDYSKAKD